MNLKYETAPTFKGGTFISYGVVQCSSLLHNFAKETQNPGSMHCEFLQIFDKDLKCFIYLGSGEGNIENI